MLYCSQALAEVGVAETVSVPTREEDGSIGNVMVLIGPASQIVARDVHEDGEELVDATAVARLNAIQRRLRPVAAVDTEAPDMSDWDGDL
nr:hypothetical protein [Microbacterium ureisolvens]